LTELRDIRSTGAAQDETGYYGPLGKLLDDVGKPLKPRVHCIMGLKNQGAGMPDGGLFTPDQFQKKTEHPRPGQLPSRGAIEVKPTSDSAWLTAQGKQVSRYWGRYRKVLVTNYRDFVLVGQDREGRPAKLESFRLAEDENSFWAAVERPRSTDGKLGRRLVEYLQRVMHYEATLTTPEDVAWFLASYAREAKARIEGVQLPALANVRAALEEALGLKFEGEKGEHFFRSSLVQTLFYGGFSAWVLWSKQHPPTSIETFDWNAAARYLRVPMISKLFHLVSDYSELERIGLVEVLDWTGQALNRVDRRSFFDRFQETHAVQYFYEPFLEEFDPELRKALGVWYTPPEVVKYMVERVDRVLREELNLKLGLADKNVYVLDPCCGTGSYLVEVLDRIHRTLKENGGDALLASDLKEAAQERVFGFEILPAPFVVSHLQLGLLLQNLGAPLSGKQRVGVYLTNALTGWEPPKGPKQHLIFPELEEERDAAEHVKREAKILVILGNPPYNAFAGVSPVEEQGLVEPYKNGLISEWGIKKFNLDDLYVRFFRLAERRIAQGPPGKGVVCFISNFSYLSDPSFVVMRRSFLSEFDKLWFDCMNGDSRETGKLTPECKPDPSVFSTERNREGIRVGTAIGLMARVRTRTEVPNHRGNSALAERLPNKTVRFRHFWGVTKNFDLVESLNGAEFETHYQPAQPDRSNRFSFRPQGVTIGYLSWPGVDGFAELPSSLGILENRRDALISVDRGPLQERMRKYYDRSTGWEELKAGGWALTENMARFNARAARAKVLSGESFSEDSIRKLMVRPMDVRLCYYTAVRPIWNEPRLTYVEQCWMGNRAFVTRRKGVARPEGVPFLLTSAIGAQHALNTDAYYVPLLLRRVRSMGAVHGQAEFPGDNSGQRANLSSSARAYLGKLGIESPDANPETARLIWMHALAIGYSPAYLAENADGIRQDWPRIPLPDSKEALLASAALGKQIAALLDTETPFAQPRAADPLQTIAVPAKLDGGQLDESKDFEVTAGWGHAGKGGVTMPGKGRPITRDYTGEERKTLGDVIPLLGEQTLDIYLNEMAYWRNIPVRVWEYTIGGYQVIKKWLSYREGKLLGRSLTKDEVRYVQEMAQRIAAILLLEPTLDANYQAVKERAYPWSK